MNLKKFFVLMLVALTAITSSCKYDDDELWDTVNSLAERISALETLTKQMNSDIAAMQSVISALENKVYVSEVEKLTDGYILHFTDGTTATIKNGTNGLNGKDAPVINVKQENGVYYWTITVDGETTWLTDDKGNKLPVSGTDGENGTNGKNGVTPLLKVDGDGYWMVSYDNGSSYTYVLDSYGHKVYAVGPQGPAGSDGEDGEDGNQGNQGIQGDSQFKGVEVDEENGTVTITLADGTEIVIPITGVGVAYTTTKDGEVVEVDAKAIEIGANGGSVTLKYEVSKMSNATVEVLSEKGVSVSAVDESKQEITITEDKDTKTPISEAKVVLLYYNDEQTLTSVLKFKEAWSDEAGDKKVRVNSVYYETIAEALEANKNESNITVELAEGEFLIPASVSNGGTITFNGIGENSILNFNSTPGGADGGLNSYADDTNLIFDNVKVVSPNTGSAYTGGFGRAKSVLFKKCIYIGQYRTHGPTQFINCIIDPQTSYIYTDYFNVDFETCTFNASKGKAIQIYNDGKISNTTININNCTFKAEQIAYTYPGTLEGGGKPVTPIDINSDGEKFTVNITNCTAIGFGTGEYSGSDLWNIKGGAEYVTVVIDGKQYIADGAVLDVETGVYEISTAAGLQTTLPKLTDAGSGNCEVNITENIDLTNIEWTPVTVDGYYGADVITINGNNKIITGLNAPLFAGGFAGGSGIVIKDLTIDKSNIVTKNSQGSGAFIECSDSQDKISLENCHLKNSTLSCDKSIDGSRMGGLIGWTAGYNNENDGPVKMYVTIKNCSVISCEINAKAGSVGGLYGHAGNNPWTFSTVENCTVQNCKLNSTDDGDWRVGVVVGTANVGELTISNITESGNTLTQTGKTAPEGQSNLYGRFVPGETGKLTINGTEIK